MKKWLREWKLKTIEQTNPDWHDLWPEITGEKPQAVVPAPDNTIRGQAAGTQQNKNAFDSSSPLDSRLRGNDGAFGVAR